MNLRRENNIDTAITKIEILSFFQANPHTRDTLKGFSLRLFMDYEFITEAMNELVGVGIVEKIGIGEKAIYRLKISYSTLEDYIT